MKPFYRNLGITALVLGSATAGATASWLGNVLARTESRCEFTEFGVYSIDGQHDTSTYERSTSTHAVTADLDSDGDIDVIVVSDNGGAKRYVNLCENKMIQKK